MYNYFGTGFGTKTAHNQHVKVVNVTLNNNIHGTRDGTPEKDLKNERKIGYEKFWTVLKFCASWQ